MKKAFLTVVLFLVASLAQADLYETKRADGTVSFSDRASSTAKRHNTEINHPLQAGQLPGIWEATSTNGLRTELTLNDDGSFVFSQANDNSLHRVYMCGTWEGSEDALALVVKGLKRRLASGDIEQADGSHQELARILSGQRDRMIVVIDGQELVFDRAG